MLTAKINRLGFNEIDNGGQPFRLVRYNPTTKAVTQDIQVPTGRAVFTGAAFAGTDAECDAFRAALAE